LFVGPSDKTPTSLIILNAETQQDGCDYKTGYISDMFLKKVMVDDTLFKIIRKFAEHNYNNKEGNSETFNQMAIGYECKESGYKKLAILQPGEQPVYFNKLAKLLRKKEYPPQTGANEILEWMGD